MKKPKPRYYVYTWDMDRQEFTPQIGCRCGPYSLFGLRRALRKLRELGYDTSRKGGVSVLVCRDDQVEHNVPGHGRKSGRVVMNHEGEAKCN